jgi:acetyl esterase/lipase
MVGQCREATAFVARNAHTWNGDARRIYIVGHSSGAHLASNVVVTDWEKYGLPSDTIKGFAEILDGKHDDVPEANFYMKGGIDSVKKA